MVGIHPVSCLRRSVRFHIIEIDPPFYKLMVWLAFYGEQPYDCKEFNFANYLYRETSPSVNGFIIAIVLFANSLYTLAQFWL